MNSLVDEPDPLVREGDHPLEHVYTFWYTRRPTGQEARAQANYEKNIRKIGTFAAVRRALVIRLLPFSRNPGRAILVFLQPYGAPQRSHEHGGLPYVQKGHQTHVGGTRETLTKVLLST
jgi:hypothetical protein